MKNNIKKGIKGFFDTFIVDPLKYHRRLAEQTTKLEEKTNFVMQELSSIRDILNKAAQEISLLSENELRIYHMSKANYDQIPSLREKLLKARQTEEYEMVFKNREPLITVRIATYNNAKGLVERAIKSVLAQTYQNFEIIVVGDHCTDDTEEKIRAIGDSRISFYDFPFRNVYPDDPVHNWMVAGSPGMNLGAELANGDWIAPLDDDDEFTEDHLEKLLRFAFDERYEMVYGKIISRSVKDGKEKEIWSYPPEYGKFSFQGAIYMKLLNFFEWDVNSWVVDEPGDWNMCRRMMATGVRIGAMEDVVGIIHFVHLKKR